MTNLKINNVIKYKVGAYAIEKDPVKILGRNFRLRISYKNTKVSELNLSGRDIHVFLPNKYKKIGNLKILNLALDKMYEAIAKDEIERIMEETRIMLGGLAPEDYELKTMQGTLACCTENKKIIINPEIVKYDRKVIKYIILHEFCHLKYKSHCRRFYEMIEKYMPDYHVHAKQIENLKY